MEPERQLPRYKDQQTDDDRRDRPLNITHRSNPSRRVAVDAPPSIEQQQQHHLPQPFPTYKDQVNDAADQNLHLRRNSSNNDNDVNRRSATATPISPAMDSQLGRHQQMRVNDTGSHRRLPDFKDQARSAIVQRHAEVTNIAVAVDLAMLPSYKDQVLGERDRHRGNMASPPSFVTDLSPHLLQEVQPSQQQHQLLAFPDFKHQVNSVIQVRTDEASVASDERLPNYKDQVFDGRNDIDRLLPTSNIKHPGHATASKSTSPPQWNKNTATNDVPQQLPDYKDQVQSVLQVVAATDHDSDEHDSRRPHYQHKQQQQQQLHAFPDFKHQVNSVIQARTDEANVASDEHLPNYKDQVFDGRNDIDRLLPSGNIKHPGNIKPPAHITATKSLSLQQQNINNRTNNLPTLLPNYKDQVQSVLQVVAATDHDSDEHALRRPHYQFKQQQQSQHLFESKQSTNTETTPSVPMGRLPNYKDQAQSILPVQVRAEADVVVDTVRLPQYKDQVLGENDRNATLPTTSGASATPGMSQNSYLPNYKDQIQSLLPTQIRATDVVNSTRLPQCKDQVLDGNGLGESTPTKAVSGTTKSHSRRLPDYKDQAQSVLQVSATDDNVVDTASRLPEYKDQVIGENERVVVPLTTQLTGGGKQNVAQGVDPVGYFPNYKDQALGEDVQLQRHRIPVDNSKDTNPATESSLSLHQSNSDPHVRQSRQPLDTDQEDSTTSVLPPPINETPNSDTHVEFLPERVDAATMAFAEPYVEVPVYHASDPIVPQGGVSYAEGVGVLVDIVFDNDDGHEESPEADEALLAELSTAVKLKKYLGFQNKRSMLLVIGAVVLLIVGVMIGSVCGSGACTTRSTTAPGTLFTSSTTTPNNNNVNPTFPPTQQPTIDYPIPFSNTNELYNAVDEFMAAFYGNNSRETNVTTIYGPIGDWDVSQLTNLALVFHSADRTSWPGPDLDLSLADIPPTLFNEDISRWNISSATTLEGMFAGASVITGLDLSNWDTSRVTTMRGMFHSASSFDGNLQSWNVQSVMDFSGMFIGCTEFTGKGLDVWNIESGQILTHMFARAINFDANLSGWNTNKVTSLRGTFQSCNIFNGTGLEGWNVSSVTTMDSMFYLAVAFNRDLSLWDTRRVTNLRRTFQDATVFNSDLPWDVSQVTTMSATFQNTLEFGGNIGSWDTSQCTDMTDMFSGHRFDLNLSSWNTGRVLRMNGMFELSSYFNSNIGQWNVSNVVTMSRMFRETTTFNQDISGWDIRRVTAMDGMFQGALAFSQNLCPWGTLIASFSSTINTTGLQLLDIFSGAPLCESTAAPNISHIIAGPWCTASCTGT